MDFLTRLFDTSDFPPRWECGAWTSEHGWLHIASDLGVWSAYVAIPCVLLYFILRRRDLPFRRIFVLFGAFILFCGTTHLLEAIIFWWPAYRLAALVKFLTAVVSWATVIALIPVTPQVLAMRSSDELEREIADRKVVEAELARSNAELDKFAYVASHDLQEPLRMVSSYMDLLSQRYQGHIDEKADRWIGFARDGAVRMKVLINDLLEFSRVDSRGKSFETVDGEKVLAMAMVNLQQLIAESGAAVSHGPLPTVIGDKAQLMQVFQNLIGNAIKFHGRQPPEIHVRAEPKDGDWLFSVRDNGIGIDPQFAERIFVIFQRLHTREEYPGTGIGLAVCKKIVERHGGRIWVESKPGQGATFFFSIPNRKGVANGRAKIGKAC